MGEYALFKNERIKIGTCEDMLYLRWDQRHLITALDGNVDVNSAEEQSTIRFRFPWPEEDNVLPGAFDADKSFPVSLPMPKDLDHLSVQFSARPGCLISIPCPEGPEPHPYKIYRNGFSGAVLLVQQAVRQNHLVPVFRCGGCGSLWSEPELTPKIQTMLDALRNRAYAYAAKIADRIEQGYAEYIK